MDKHQLEARTRDFAVSVIRFVSTMPRSKAADVLGRQLLRSGTSVGANYREANRAESPDDFIHKMAIVEKEASETQYWLELCAEAGLGDESSRQRLYAESGELLAIFTAAGRTAKSRRNRSS